MWQMRGSGGFAEQRGRLASLPVPKRARDLCSLAVEALSDCHHSCLSQVQLDTKGEAMSKSKSEYLTEQSPKEL